jgi:hypothetical protein
MERRHGIGRRSTDIAAAVERAALAADRLEYRVARQHDESERWMGVRERRRRSLESEWSGRDNYTADFTDYDAMTSESPDDAEN